MERKIDIVIIEDNKELGTLLKDFITKEGYQVYVAHSGEDGLQFLKQYTVKLVLLDIMLPGIDGFGICQLIREKGNIPIIIMSAKVEKEDRRRNYNLREIKKYYWRPCRMI